MKQLIIALCAMWLGFAACAQSNTPVAAAAPPPVDSTSTTSADNTRYVNEPDLLTACAAQVASFNNKPCDLIFIGDSITSNWLTVGKDIWAKNYVPRHALNFGVNGDKTQNVIWRLNNMEVQNLKPKVAVIMIGKNNKDNTAHEIADGVKAVLTNTQATFPGVKIILVSILPNDQALDKIMQADSLLRGLADNESVYFLNLIPLMPSVTIPGTTDSNWKGLGPDRIHPDATGYQIWADAMEPMLVKLMAGGQ